MIEDDLHAAVATLGGVIRVAGMVEFAGYDRTLTSARIQNLVKLLKAILPELQYDRPAVKEWCGLRPVCSYGVPIIGRTSVANLLVNTGPWGGRWRRVLRICDGDNLRDFWYASVNPRIGDQRSSVASFCRQQH